MEISNGAYREAEDTRPLGLKCSDNKVIAGVANHTWKSMLADQLGQAQRGFLSGRYPSLNILDLDAWCRKLSFPGASELPLLVLFDFAAAFPSISHRFLFTVLRWLKVPAGLMRLLEAFYTEVRGLGLSGQELFRIFAGVLQGCPLSGSLFTISIDAFMRALQKLAADEARVAACADDIGLVVGAAGILGHFEALYSRLESLSRLTLKPPKCITVPLGAPFSDALALTVKLAISRAAPRWSGFSIQASATYLGWRMGPCAQIAQWADALAKYRHRVEMIATTNVMPFWAMKLYNERCVPVLSYLPSFGPTPPELFKMESHALHRLLGLPGNCGTLQTFGGWHRFGGPSLNTAFAVTRAVSFRTAARLHSFC